MIPVRAIGNEATQAFMVAQKQIIEDFKAGTFTQQEAQLQIEHFWAGALRRAVVDGDVITGSIMAGQSVGMVTAEQSIDDVVQELVNQALESISIRNQLYG